ncbi:hypothetical protein SAMN02982929_03672 [Saccharopolyspora kobensis]|uniref:Uncharacterized protein n=2 Tax=Saccharopolyspora kobensis TaxID=146035 RepID=A0A1H6CXD6_9PSEU|nr:hypothetical protein SAMN02982929_03672 [Saccharopolyspora kobensis]SFD03205.1 hypothetical protein SAMN05216506_102266 [Saccharopolyspora kobensis]
MALGNEVRISDDTLCGVTSRPVFFQAHHLPFSTARPVRAVSAREEVVMHLLLQHQGRARHRRLSTAPRPRRSPLTRRQIAEQLFRHTSWVQRKPGAMWDAVPAAPSAAVR